MLKFSIIHQDIKAITLGAYIQSTVISAQAHNLICSVRQFIMLFYLTTFIRVYDIVTGKIKLVVIKHGRNLSFEQYRKLIQSHIKQSYAQYGMQKNVSGTVTGNSGNCITEKTGCVSFMIPIFLKLPAIIQAYSVPCTAPDEIPFVLIE